MIHAAHASRYHWSRAGTTVNLGRGEWQAGDRDQAVAWRDRARAALERVADPADREVVEGDLATIPL
jgi:hypothetical protein